MLKAQSLTYCIQSKPLIQEITLDFFPGVLHGILGPNGAGKSTLLKTLAGIWPPTKGSVLWKGEDLLKKKTRKEISQTISLVLQSNQMYFDFSVLDIIKMGRYPHGSSFLEKEKKLLEETLNLLNIIHLQHRPVSHLSHGERQRVYIARALMTESPILLLDEPTANLDIRHQHEIWQMLRTQSNQGKIIIVSSHDLNAIKHYCDQVAVIHQGKCIASGTYSATITPLLTQKVFLGGSAP